MKDDFLKGRINSFQSMGAVDGPGLRFVVFLQGCPLRCAYCHNPETWSIDGGDEYSVDEVMNKALRYRPYFGESGGVTVSGGEPLLQWEFVSELFQRLKGEGIHTALDTSGVGNPYGAEEALRNTDLVLCDLKFPTEEGYRQYCKGSLHQVLSFLELTEKLQTPLWIRHVVVPGLTDSEESIREVTRMARQYSNLHKIELLPFRKLCTVKYDAMGVPFPLADHSECPDEAIRRLSDLFL
jgi:pyruvate formate lyase activating enzyme